MVCRVQAGAHGRIGRLTSSGRQRDPWRSAAIRRNPRFPSLSGNIQQSVPARRPAAQRRCNRHPDLVRVSAMWLQAQILHRRNPRTRGEIAQITMGTMGPAAGDARCGGGRRGVSAAPVELHSGGNGDLCRYGLDALHWTSRNLTQLPVFLEIKPKLRTCPKRHGKLHCHMLV